MKSKNSGAKRGGRRPGRAEASSPSNGAARRPALLALAWIAILVATLALGGCPRFTWAFAAYAVSSLGLALAALAFLKAIYLDDRAALFPAFKKFLGYGLVLHYVAAALPRIGWANEGLIGPAGVAYRFVLALLPLSAGCAAFAVAGRPSVHAALGLISAEEARDPALRRKRRAARKKGFVGSVLEWVDALAFAVILVVVVNIFVFQLYVVPSESMVPVFLSGDRPFTAKLIAGPRIPLTEWRLPFARSPARGDVVTIANPRYPENHRVDPKKYLAQVVAMITFTGVNIDTLPDGSPKADPLVKRIVGMPGEKLMMVDDALYARREGEKDFARLEADRTWSRTDLWKESAETRARIATIPVDERTRAVLAAWDERKRAADPRELAARLAEAGARIERKLALAGPLIEAFERRELPKAPGDLASGRDSLVAEAAAAGADNPLSRRGAGLEDLSATLALSRSPQLRRALGDYARAPAPPAGDAYARGSAALNLLIKHNFLARVDRDLSLMTAGASVSQFTSDPERARLVAEARELLVYLHGFYDARNFPEFPAGGRFLAPDEYFAMGDNRYNSLDFRFASTQATRALDPGDPTSIVYPSSLAPFALQRKFIEGFALFRLWPPSRIGAIK